MKITSFVMGLIGGIIAIIGGLITAFMGDFAGLITGSAIYTVAAWVGGFGGGVLGIIGSVLSRSNKTGLLLLLLGSGFGIALLIIFGEFLVLPFIGVLMMGLSALLGVFAN